jgi:GTP-binding protein EngB required for normal cell division
MITVILQVDRLSTLEDLKRRFLKYQEKNICQIEIFETKNDKISNVEFCELNATELEELFDKYNDTEGTAEILHARVDNEVLRKIRQELEDNNDELMSDVVKLQEEVTDLKEKIQLLEEQNKILKKLKGFTK